jgi:PKD repeat protein
LASHEQNPVVTYPHPGTYTVSLTSGNIYGSSDIIRPEFITVTEPFRIPDKSILVKTGKRGYIEKDSVVEFVVLDRPASISINGGYRELGNGSIVRLDAMSDQEGEIFIDRGEIIKFSFPDIALYVNGELVSVGAIDSIYIPASTDFKTSLSYYLVPNSAYTLITVDGFNVLGDLDTAWIRISNLGMDKDGRLRVTSSSNSTYIDGAMNQTVHDWVIT